MIEKKEQKSICRTKSKGVGRKDYEGRNEGLVDYKKSMKMITEYAVMMWTRNPKRAEHPLGHDAL